MKIENLNVVKIYHTDDGHSHFEDVALPVLYPVGPRIRQTKILSAGKICEFDSDFIIDWHLAKKPVYFIYLQGGQEIEVSDGEKRKFFSGDILLVEDTIGFGHRSRSISQGIGRVIVLDI